MSEVRYEVVRGRGRVDVFRDGVQVAQAAFLNGRYGNVVHAVLSSDGKWFGHEVERITLDEYASRWA